MRDMTAGTVRGPTEEELGTKNFGVLFWKISILIIIIAVQRSHYIFFIITFIKA